MSLALQRSNLFIADFDLQFRWYLSQAGETIADRYLDSVERTLHVLAEQPGLGRKRQFVHPDLKAIRSYRVHPPFDAHLIFYRFTSGEISAERIMHGRRDLPMRLRQAPEST